MLKHRAKKRAVYEGISKHTQQWKVKSIKANFGEGFFLSAILPLHIHIHEYMIENKWCDGKEEREGLYV